MTELLDRLPPSGIEMLVTWLSPLGPAAAERKPTDPSSFWLVTRVAGPDDKVTDFGTYSVHSFGNTMTEAEDLSLLAHRRVLTMGPPLAPQRRVTISGSRTVVADRVMTDLFPRYEYYSDTIRRFVGRYDIDLRFIAV